MARESFWDVAPTTSAVIPGGMRVTLTGVSPETWPKGSCAEHVIAAAARTSLDNHDKQTSAAADARLVRRLYRDRHTSPIEMASATFQIRAPKFVTIQLLRHRTFHVNEESQRYHKVAREYFSPWVHDEYVRSPHPDNKQSSVPVERQGPALSDALRVAETVMEDAFHAYDKLIDCGLARESARYCLPLGTMSTIVVKCDLHNLTNFLRLRLADDAQYETQLVARAMYHLAKQAFPVVLEEFLSHSPRNVDDASIVYE